MSASFLPFPTRFFSRKSRSKRAKTSTPDNLAQPTSVVPLTSSQHGPLRTAPAHHSHTQGYAASRQTSASIRSAPHTTDTYNPRRYGDSYLPRKIPSLNELQRRAAVTSPPPRPHARQVFNGREMSDQPSSMAGRFTPWNGAPQHMPYSRGQREEAWRSRRFSEQPSHPLVSVPLSRAASVDGHHALEPPWNGVVAASIEEESESDQEGPLGPLEVLEAFFNEEPMPEWIILPSPPTSPRASSPPAPSPVPMAAQPAPPPPFPPPRPPFPPPPPPSSSPPPPPSAVRARSRTPQLHSDRQQLQPITPPRRQSSAAVDGGTAAYEVAVNGHVPTHASSLTAANSTSSPASSQSAASRSPFSLPRLRRNSSRASKLEGPSNPPSPAHDDDLPYHQRPLPPTPPERGDSFRNRLLRNRRRSGDATLPDSIQEEEIEHPLAQLSDALRLSPAPRPVSLVAYIIPPEERAQIGRHRRGSWSSTSSMSDSVYSPHNLSLPTPQSSPQPMPISPFRSTFSPPTGLNPPPRPRSSMVSTRSAGSSNHHAWSPPTTTRTSSTLRPSPMLHDDPIAQW